MAISRPLFCVRKWAREPLRFIHATYISPRTHQLEKTLEVSFIAKAKISLVLLAFLICWQRIFSPACPPAVFPGPSVGILHGLPAVSLPWSHPVTLGSFVLQLLFCVWCLAETALHVLCWPWGPLLHTPSLAIPVPPCALLCTVSRWADSPRTRGGSSHQIYQFVRRMWRGRRWGRWCIFHPCLIFW